MDESEIAENLLSPPPERVGPYRIEDRLGVGGMGAVYRAYDERLERTVAIKQILPELAGDAKAWKRHRREAKAVARMNHQTIVQIYDIEEHSSGDWIVMELVDGETLFAMVQDGPLELDLALDLIRQITAGVAAAHASGVIHRDLKTENVMVTPDRRIKILDFGLAKAQWRGADKSISIEGSILGTGRAMSPEQALGDEVSYRSDLFSLGTLIYEVVTGEAPFSGSSIFRVLAQVCSDPHPPPRSVNPAIPEDLAALIDRLLEKDPAKRPEGAEEVLAILDPIEASDSGQAPAPAIAAPEPATPAGDGDRAGDDTLWMHPGRRPGARRKESTSGLHIRTLLRITLKQPRRGARLGSSRAQVVATRHDRMVRDLLAKSGGLEIDKLDDGFLLLFELPWEAVSYALTYQEKLADFRQQEGVDLEAGAGIHLGEMHMTENLPADVTRGAKLLEVQGPAKLIAGRAADLAGGGQTLMTQMAFELARRALAGDETELSELDWVAHGRYRFQDVGEEQPIFEVGPPGKTSSRPPAGTPATRRLPGRRDDEAPVTSEGLRRWLLPITAVAALLALGFWWLMKQRAEVPDPGGLRRSTIAVLGFKNLSGRPETDWPPTALAALLPAHRAAGGDPRLAAGASIARMKLELELPATETLAEDTLKAVHRNLGTDHVLGGSYLVLDRQDEPLRLNLRLQPTSEGETIFVNITGRESQLFELVSGAALQLRQKLGLGNISTLDQAAVKATLSTSPDANRLYSEGLNRLRAYDARGARDLLQQAVQTEPVFALAHAALSDAWSALGFDREALTSARSAFEQAKGLPEEQRLAIQGRFYEADSRWQEAVDTFRALWDKYPDDVEYGLRLAEVQTSAGRGKDALVTAEELRRLPAPAREDPRIDLARANAAYSQSDYQAVVSATKRAEDKGRDLSAKVLVAEALYVQGRALQRLGRNVEAVEHLEDARTIFEGVGNQGKVAQALTSIAVVSKLGGDLSGAEGLYGEALSIHRQTGNRKETSRLLNNLAIVIQERGELETARPMLEEAVAIERQDDRQVDAAGYLGALAQLRLLQGDLEAAGQLAGEALPIFQETSDRGGQAWIHFYLGGIAFAGGDVTSAAKELEMARAMCTEIGNRHLCGRVRNAQGELLLAAGDPAEADKALRDASSIRSELGEQGTAAQTQLIRGQMLIATGRFVEAETLMREASIELSREARRDDDITANVVLARALLAQGRLTEARETADRARTRARDSQSPAIRIAAAITEARLLAAAGDFAPAISRLETTLAEVTNLGLLGLAFEARLALGETEIASGTSRAAAGRARLRALADEARRAGFGLIARAAEEH